MMLRDANTPLVSTGELKPGDQVPHFEVTTIDGHHVKYAELWQRRNLILVVAGDTRTHDHPEYLKDLRAAASEFKSDSEFVITTVPVPGLPDVMALVADRWGQIAYLAYATDDRGRLPDIGELLEWVHFIRAQCPECPP